MESVVFMAVLDDKGGMAVILVEATVKDEVLGTVSVLDGIG